MNIKDVGLNIHTECEALHKKNPLWIGEDLNGACAIASYSLYEFLKNNNLNSKFVLGTYNDIKHCWVELDKQIIDLTATQFGSIHKVYTPLKDSNYYPQFYNKFALNIVRGWGDQSPFKYSYCWNNNTCTIKKSLYGAT